jgi:hypothetical protein
MLELSPASCTERAQRSDRGTGRAGTLNLRRRGRQAATIAAHGAATGALYAMFGLRGGTLRGAASGVQVWIVSCFGIVPGLRILRRRTIPAGRKRDFLRRPADKPRVGAGVGEEREVVIGEKMVVYRVVGSSG